MIKLTVYMKSGAKIEFECKSFKFFYDNKTFEFNGYEISGDKPSVSFVPSQIEAYTVE